MTYEPRKVIWRVTDDLLRAELRNVPAVDGQGAEIRAIPVTEADLKVLLHLVADRLGEDLPGPEVTPDLSEHLSTIQPLKWGKK